MGVFWWWNHQNTPISSPNSGNSQRTSGDLLTDKRPLSSRWVQIILVFEVFEFSPESLKVIQGAADVHFFLSHSVRVDHGGFEVFVAE